MTDAPPASGTPPAERDPTQTDVSADPAAAGRIYVSLGVDDLLVQFATELYPAFLIPLPADPLARMTGRPTNALFQHSERYAFQAAVLADATLCRLFPDNTEHGGRSGFVYRSTGAGSGVQLVSFATVILDSAWRSLQPMNRQPTLAEFLQAVADTLAPIRRAILGKSTVVRALIGLAGIRLSEGQSIDLPFGRLRTMTEGDREFMPPVTFLRGAVAARQGGGEALADPNGNAVLDIRVPYRIKLTPPDPHSRTGRSSWFRAPTRTGASRPCASHCY